MVGLFWVVGNRGVLRRSEEVGTNFYQWTGLVGVVIRQILI